MVAVSSLLLSPSLFVMAYGELVQIERESFLTSAAIWIALHSWKFSVGFYLKRFHNISLSRLNAVDVSDQRFRVILKELSIL